MIRGAIPGFEVYGQPGCWQDAAVLFGIENLIYETADDPGWVHTFLRVLMERKLAYIRSMNGAKFDLLELGGGDASSTVISPHIFDEFVAPYDGPLIGCAHEMGQRVADHNCGGMMPLLERIAGMNPDAMETFTPPSMGRHAAWRKRKGGSAGELYDRRLRPVSLSSGLLSRGDPQRGSTLFLGGWRGWRVYPRSLRSLLRCRPSIAPRLRRRSPCLCLLKGCRSSETQRSSGSVVSCF